MAATSKKINQPLLFSTAQRVEILKKTVESIRLRMEFVASLEISQRTSTRLDEEK